MKGNRIILGIEFSALRNYLDHAFEESGREIEASLPGMRPESIPESMISITRCSIQ